MLALIAVAFCIVVRGEDAYLTITQPLDHGCVGSTCETFEQSYVWINDTGYERGGPVVLFVGGESSKYNYQTRLSQFVKYCFMTKATFVELEHRFYGASVPDFSSSSSSSVEPFSVQNLQYLTVEQALDDIHAFAQYFQNKYMPAGTKWFIAGEGYGGSLAAWYTSRHAVGHPEFVSDSDGGSDGAAEMFIGSIASSAPIEAKVDYSAYLQSFGQAAVDMAAIDADGNTNPAGDASGRGAACASALRNGTRAIDSLFADSASNSNSSSRRALAQAFGACETTISAENEFFFKWMVSEVIASTLELNTAPAWSLNRTCEAALDRAAEGANGNGSSNINIGISESVAAVQRAFAWNMQYDYELCIEECNGTTPLQRVSEVLTRPLVVVIDGDSSGGGSSSSCVSFDEAGWLASLGNESNSQRAWWWQRCSQLGWFHGTAADSNASNNNNGSTAAAAAAGVFFPGLGVDRLLGYCASMFQVRAQSHGGMRAQHHCG